MNEITRETLVRAWALIVALGLAVWYIGASGAVATFDGSVRVSVAVSGEDGSPIAATLRLEGLPPISSDEGTLEVEVDQPVFGFVEADGFLSEPIVVAPQVPTTSVSLVAATGSGGPRRVLHFGGDAMLGRRYATGEAAGGVRNESDAAGVVSDLAPLFGAADLSVANLETVVGDDLGPGYPGKRFLLATPEDGLAALATLGIDVAALGNNHAYDWGDPGLAATAAALDRAGIAHVGAGSTPEAAAAPILTDVGGLVVGHVSFTTVTGDVVNDALPRSGDTEPDGLPEDERWQYERRSVSFEYGGDEYWAPEPMLPGEAWARFEALEGELPVEVSAALWAALTAPEAFPELQDWVARRGHGGAARFDRAVAAQSIAEARAGGAQVVVAQLHAGLQYAPVASEFVVTASRALVDAGADVVVAHHPHVLQGFEWYAGAPIAHSLGNLVFDQDFTATFASVVLRVVVDAEGVVAVRAYPFQLVDHRPVPVAGGSAGSIGQQVAARSAGSWWSVKAADGSPVVVGGEAGGSRVTAVGWGWEIAPGVAGAEPSCQLLENGSFEDDVADGRRRGSSHWRLHGAAETVAVPDAADGLRVLRFEAGSGSFARPIGRAALPAERIVGQGADRSVVLAFSARGRGELGVRFDGFRFVDTDPTRDPTSVATGSHETGVVVSDSDWHRFEIPVPVDLLRSSNAVMPYLTATVNRGATIEVDGMTLTETRAGPVGCFR